MDENVTRGACIPSDIVQLAKRIMETQIQVFSTVLTPDKSISHMWAWFSVCGMAFPCAEMGEKGTHRS